MSNYSNDVFFKPWVGDKYEDGIKLNEKGEIIVGTKDNKGLKVMILGLEHYCTSEYCHSKNEEQSFYIECLKKINARWSENNPNNIDTINKEIEKLEKLYQNIEKNSDLSKVLDDKQKIYKDKIYVLCENLKKRGNKILQLENQKINLDSPNYGINTDSNNSLLLSMAIEKVLTVNVLWEKTNRAKKIIEIANAYFAIKDCQCHINSPCKGNIQCNYKLEDTNCGICTNIPICMQRTKRQIHGYIMHEKEHPSHKKFREAFFGPKSIHKDWENVGFFNFFQIGMPYKKSDKNEDYRNKAKINETERENAVKAFIDMVEEYKPNIIIAWETKKSNVYTTIRNYLIDHNKNVKMRYINVRKKPHIPRIKIDFIEQPFTVLDYGNNEKCLISFLQHPAAHNYNKENNLLLIHCLLKFYPDLIQWTDTHPKNIKTKKSIKPAIFKYNTQFTPQNSTLNLLEF